MRNDLGNEDILGYGYLVILLGTYQYLWVPINKHHVREEESRSC
jgi:type II secretory pathway component PulM